MLRGGQELLAAQLIRAFADIFADSGLPLQLRPYEVLVTSNRTALIELVPDSLSIHQARPLDGLGFRVQALWVQGAGHLDRTALIELVPDRCPYHQARPLDALGFRVQASGVQGAGASYHAAFLEFVPNSLSTHRARTCALSSQHGTECCLCVTSK